jgi:tRNA nucleotidyltransferase (CCA-adding enzyme)
VTADDLTDLGEGILDARKGDYHGLIRRLRDKKYTLTMSERNCIADILAGKIKRPKHRPKSKRTEEDYLEIAWGVIMLQDLFDFLPKNAISDMAKKFHIRRGERTVRHALKFAEAYDGGRWWKEQREDLARLRQLRDAYQAKRQQSPSDAHRSPQRS